MSNIIFNSITSGRSAVIHVPDGEYMSGNQLHDLVAQKEAIPSDLFTVFYNGKSISHDTDVINFTGPHVVLHVCLSCPGGKGGFGSMLRAIGAQIEKTTNKDACRDLSGRRLRDVNAEKKIKEYIAKQAKRKEQENKKRKEKLARLRRQPKIEFKDEEYFKSRSLLPEVVDDAVTQGMRKVLRGNQKKTPPSATVTSATASQSDAAPVPAADPVIVPCTSTSSTPATAGASNTPYLLKRKAVSTAVSDKKLKSCLWLGVDEDVSSDDE